MIPRGCSRNLIACATVLFASLAVHLDVRAADPSAPEAGDHGKILVEIFLAPDRRPDLASVKKAFEAVSVTRVRVQFFRLGNPPANIAIGDSVPASVARL